MYGAGNIGRGFIGQIFYQSGYELTFIDVAEKVIEELNREGRYPVRILSDSSSRDPSPALASALASALAGIDPFPEGDSGFASAKPNEVLDVWVEGVTAINGRNEEEAAGAIAGADIMATAVGVRVLPLIAPVIVKGLKKRFSRANSRDSRTFRPLNIIICENLIDANKLLEGLIKKYLNEEEQRIFDESVGLVEASIGRMVPLQTAEMQDGNPLRVCVEAYGFLPVDKAAFRGEIPSLEGMRPFDNFDFYIQRKLFVHNMGHAICAYLGMLRGDEYIYETVTHGGILFIAQNAMLESALALSAKYNASLPDLHYHIRDLLRRFSNKALGDTCTRVGADTKRKLGNKDRLIGSFLSCSDEGIDPVFISVGIAAALCCHLNENSAGQSLAAAQAVLREVSGLDEDFIRNSVRNSGWIERILSFYSMFVSLSQSGSFDKFIERVIKAASEAGQKPGII